MGWTRRKDGRRPITEESGRVTRAGQEETREAKAEMEGLCKERCEEGRRGGRLEEEDTRQSRVEKTSRRGSEKLQASPHPWQKEKEEEREIIFSFSILLKPVPNPCLIFDETSCFTNILCV